MLSRDFITRSIHPIGNGLNMSKVRKSRKPSRISCMFTSPKEYAIAAVVEIPHASSMTTYPGSRSCSYPRFIMYVSQHLQPMQNRRRAIMSANVGERGRHSRSSIAKNDPTVPGILRDTLPVPKNEMMKRSSCFDLITLLPRRAGLRILQQETSVEYFSPYGIGFCIIPS